MTLTKRIQDMLPAMIVFFIVGVIGTYATVAFVVNDPWWVETLAQLQEAKAGAAEPVSGPSAAPRD